MSNRIDIDKLIKDYGESIRQEIARSANKNEVYMQLNGLPAMRERENVEYYPGLGWSGKKAKSK